MKFPFYEQYDTMDCGACCLQMIAAFYNRSYPLETMRRLAFAGVEGVSLLRISNAAETLGFKTVGGLVSFDTIISTLLFFVCANPPTLS